MAVINSPLFNAATGRVGNTVFRNVRRKNGTRGVDIAAYQPIVSNPQTDAQMRQRVLFGTAAKLAGGLRQSIGMQNLYTIKVGNKSQFNWFIQNFLAPDISSTIEIVEAPTFPEGGIANTGELASGLSLAQAQVRYTQGALSFTQIAVENAIYTAGTPEILFDNCQWSANLGANDMPEDSLILWMVNLFTGETFTQDTGSIRSDGAGGAGVSITLSNSILATTTEARVFGFSFFRQDSNGVKWSQVSYPCVSLIGTAADVLPPVNTGAYNTGANRNIPAPTWGLD